MKWERLKAKMAADPVWAEQHRKRTLELQRIRYQNPEVRRRHALASADWKDRHARGITGRKPQAPHKKAEMPKFREASFEIKFDD